MQQQHLGFLSRFLFVLTILAAAVVAAPANASGNSTSNLPGFVPTDKPQQLCPSRGLYASNLAKCRLDDALGLANMLQKRHGQYVVDASSSAVKGKINHSVAIAKYGTCTLEVNATVAEDTQGKAQQWFVGDLDAFLMAIDMIFLIRAPEGAVEGVAPCKYAAGGLQPLAWRVWDAGQKY